jgi:hypothetical protein
LHRGILLTEGHTEQVQTIKKGEGKSPHFHILKKGIEIFVSVDYDTFIENFAFRDEGS